MVVRTQLSCRNAGRPSRVCLASRRISTWAVSAAIARSEIAERVYRFALGPAAPATLAMLAMLTAVIVWGVALQAQAPRYFYGNDGILATSTEASWLGHVAVMALATLIAIAGVARAAARPPRSDGAHLAPRRAGVAGAHKRMS
jgi:hypothetical protein